MSNHPLAAGVVYGYSPRPPRPPDVCGVAGAILALLSRKTKTNAAEFTKTFYDRFVFGPDPTGDDAAETYADFARDRIARVAPAFAAVDLKEWTEELRALWLEMIGVAWTHKSKAEAALAVSEYTKAYLSSIGRLVLWETMAEYNTAVADSATHGADPSRGTGRVRIIRINEGRADFFDKWHEGRDLQAVARVANRIGSEASFKSGVLQGCVALQVTRRLGVEGSDPMMLELGTVAHGFYQGARDELDGVQLMA